MKYYSEVTKQIYDNQEACEKAELAVKEKENLMKIKKEKEASQRKAAADKVEAARKAFVEAQKAYKAALTEFCDTYGAFHTTVSSKDYEDFGSLFDIFRLF